MSKPTFARANPDEVSERIKHLLTHAQAIARMAAGETDANIDLDENRTAMSIRHLLKHLRHVEHECIVLAELLSAGIASASSDPAEAMSTPPAPRKMMQLTLDQDEAMLLFHSYTFGTCTLTRDIQGGMYTLLAMQAAIERMTRERADLLTERLFRTMKKTWPEFQQVNSEEVLECILDIPEENDDAQ